METATKKTKEKKPAIVRTFVKVEIKDDSRSLMQCGGGPLCNETR